MSAADAASASAAFPRSRGLAWHAFRRFLRQPLGVISALGLGAILVAGLVVHLAKPANLIILTPNHIHIAPALAHPFGTDNLGRDMLIRTLYGVWTTEEVAIAAAVIATVLGVVGGAIAGYRGGWLDAAVMRLADVVTAFPAVVLTLAAIVYVGEAYPHNLIIIFSGFMWAGMARIVRAHVSTVRTNDYVEAARALGSSDRRIIFRHVMPNIGGTILVGATALVGQIILIDATVEFFSYGLPSAISPSLGNLVSDVVQNKFGLGAQYNAVPNVGWWVWASPALILVLILVFLTFIGDALDAALNPTSVARA